MKASGNAIRSQARRRILIVDDHPIARLGLVQLINETPDLTVCGEAQNAQQGIQAADAFQPDLVLTDISMPGGSGLELVKEVRARHPDLPVLVFSMHDETLYAERALRAGAHGYVSKNDSESKVLEAIRQVLRGELCISHRVSSGMFNLLTGRTPAKGGSPLSQLTNREFEVFGLIGEGLATRDIARRLRISGKTVETHRIHLKEKFHFNTGEELVAHAVRWAATNRMV